LFFRCWFPPLYFKAIKTIADVEFDVLRLRRILGSRFLRCDAISLEYTLQRFQGIRRHHHLGRSGLLSQIYRLSLPASRSPCMCAIG
jgi:hypothetical protein